MREFEIYVPLHYNDGAPIETAKLDDLRRACSTTSAA